MICPFCKEEIADGAIKCKHCSSMLNADTPNLAKPKRVGDAHATINALSVSEGLKDKLRFVHENIKGTKLGLPDYGLKGVAQFKVCSWWAFFFSIFYYLVKGMWKKSLLMLMIGIIIAFLIQVLIGILISLFGFSAIGFARALDASAWVPLSVIAMQSAYYDIYRKEVLKEDFWW